MKTGILTFHKAVNYGAVLQTYALQKIMSTYGENEVINYISHEDKRRYYTCHWDKKSLISVCRSTITNLIQFIINIRFMQFRTRFLVVSEKITRKYQLKDYCNDVDAIVVGSDQVWNTEITNGDLSYFFNFDTSAKKISYAASIGTVGFQKEYINEIVKNVNDFSAISVREETALKEINKIVYNAQEVKRVLDPTLLLNKEDWMLVAKKPVNIPKTFVILYGFGINNDMVGAAKKIAEQSKAKVVLIGNYIRKLDKDICIKRFLSPQEWVYMFLQAEAVVTNSFHGTAFAINFGKFVKVYSSRTQLSDTNSRIDDLLLWFDLNKDYNNDKLLCTNVETVQMKLNDFRNMSREFINEALMEER